MNLKEEIKKLSQAEKILLVEDVWDDIAANSKPEELTEAQKTEIMRRLQLEEEGKLKIFSLEEARARIKALKKNV